ncbi:MAG TPA: cell division protein FtsA [Clostridiaceae bacterium]|nr:cell division protein FtsA [Clostridiaceae bacterium]
MLLNEELTKGAMPEDVVFSLDIGTRTIIGLVGYKNEDRFFIQAAEMIVHDSRAMLDGQIHDIAKVAQGAEKVKKALEKRLGYTLTRVSVAAAGRVLKTCQVKVERDVEEGREIDAQFVSALEMEGIQKAQLEIEKNSPENERNQFYCVGYSIVSYYLNDYVISSLLGHKGHKAGVEVLATFLPQTVVDSLYTVMERINLEVSFLTLEPIAALNLAIPKDLRLLNLALVDVGAGTSDIAITKGGTIIAYAMVPIAGDEITEAIAQNYLVDFETAEKIKIEISLNKKDVTFTDILDNQVTTTAEEVREVTRPVVEELARTVSEKILELNSGKAPNAVFLVGGGSQSEGLCEALAEALGLPKDRVAVRDRKIAKNVVTDEKILDGPDSITPIGILVTTALTRGQDFYYVTVNDQKVRMYNSRKMLVSDALILAGFNPEQLICKSGKNLKFTLNGKDKTIRGSFGKPAEIYVNDKLSSLNAYITAGDRLRVIPAEKGSDGKALVRDLLKDQEPIYLKYDDQAATIWPRVYINDEEVSQEAVVNNGDKVEIVSSYTLSDIAKLFEMDLSSWEFTVDGAPYDLYTELKPGVQIVGRPAKNPVRYDGALTGLNTGSNAEAKENSSRESDSEEAAKPANIQDLLKEVEQKLAIRDGITVTVNKKSVNLPPKKTDYLFIDVFNHIDFDLTSPKGILMLKLNGNDANFTDRIKSGDIIEIYWGE